VRALLLTPFSPASRHLHAANDLAQGLAGALGKEVELHVFSPVDPSAAQTRSDQDSIRHGNFYIHHGSPVSCSPMGRLSTYPFAYRCAWGRSSTDEAIRLVDALRPSVVHGEYVQTSEALLKLNGTPWSMTLHDLPSLVGTQEIERARGPRRLVQSLELRKVERLERRVLASAHAVITLSERDGSLLSGRARRVRVARPGLDRPREMWSEARQRSAADPVLVFGGAMWRRANQLTARYLAEDVLPRVRSVVPEARLRIVGADPSPSVRDLNLAPGVEVTGHVADLSEEFLDAAVVLAPSMLDAGVLLKALRALAMGCPVVLNSKSAGSIEGLQRSVHALVADDPNSMAAAILELLADPSLGARLGAAGSELVLRNYTWSGYAGAYAEMLREIAAQ
jgi:glycosyltransferase involved in cell wall biosynthesis